MQQTLYGLYAITDSALLSTNMADGVEQALIGGARIIQYRDKSTDQQRRRIQAGKIVELCRYYNRLCIINDDMDLAIDVGAHGVHIGKHDMALSDARKQLGHQRIIGVSCYNSLALAESAERDGADYVAFGSVFPTPVKPDAPTASMELLQTARQRLTVPIVAIGGITHQNAATVLAQGVEMLAVIHGVFNQNNIKSAAETFANMFEPH